MALNYFKHPKFLNRMYSAEICFPTPAPLKDVIALLAPERTGLPMIDCNAEDREAYYRLKEKTHQELPRQCREALLKQAEVSSVQLRFILCGVVKNWFEGQLMVKSPSDSSHYISPYEPIWYARKLAVEPAQLRKITEDFQTATMETFEGAIIKRDAYVELLHPAVDDLIEADLDGNRLSKHPLRRTEKQRWMPEGYDEPVRISSKEMNSKAMQKILGTLSAKGRAKLLALVK